MVKVVSLSNDAYNNLKEIKNDKESFSEVIIRLTKRKKDIMHFFGRAKEDKEFIKGLKKSYKERDKNELRVY